MPLTLNINAGSTFKLAIWVQDSAGDPVNLTGCAARMQLRRQYTSPDPALSLTSPSSGLAITAETGRVDITISESQTRGLSSSSVNDKYVYDLEVVFPSGEVERVLEGPAFVRPEVTK